MDKLDKIQALHQILTSRRYPVPMRVIAEKLGCTDKTARRLMDTLADLTLSSIEYSKEHKGWAYTLPPEEKNQLPGLWLTPEELQSMALLLYMLQNFGNGLVSDEIRVVERSVHKLLKIRGIDPATLMSRIKVLPMGHTTAPTGIYLRVSDALLNGRRILITYTDYKGKKSRRIISPQNLVYYRDNWYLDAWCHKQNAIRQFVLSRMEKVTLTDNPVQHVPVAELEEHFSRSYGIFAGAPENLASLRFRGNVAREVAGQIWHPEQEGHWEGDEYVLQVPYGDDRELVRDVMRFVPDVRVEGPEGLREEVSQRLASGIHQLGTE